MFYVTAGELRLVRRSSSGDEIVLQRTRGGFLAEASLDQPAYHCDAIVAEAAEVLAIPRRHFADALCDTAFRRVWSSHLTNELRHVRARAERLSLKTARERIIHFIEAEGVNGRLRLDYSRKTWAAELGLTHEALYRTIARLAADGELVVKGDMVTLRRRS